MSVSKLNFLIADDHPLIRVGITKTLENNFNGCYIEEALDGSEMLRSASIADFDLIISDINMPHVSGIQATKYILSIKPLTKVLAFSMYDDNEQVKAMFESGARGYISKEVNQEEMLNAIKAVLNGAIYISGKKTNAGFHPKEIKETAGNQKFISKREKEILLLICKGFSNKEIATTLFISIHTVENHRNHLLEKIGVHNTAGLVLYASKNGWV